MLNLAKGHKNIMLKLLKIHTPTHTVQFRDNHLVREQANRKLFF